VSVDMTLPDDDVAAAVASVLRDGAGLRVVADEARADQLCRGQRR